MDILSEQPTAPVYRFGVDLDDDQPIEHPRVMVVEDDVDTLFLLKQVLLRSGFGVMSATNGQDALRKCSELKPSLVLLDLMIHEMDGWTILHHLRQISNIPVIIISALSNKEHVVKALKSGVDDYITKPFYNEEVVARISAVLRRAGQPTEISRLVFPQVGLILDLSTQEVVYGKKTLQLTPKEFSVLAVLAKHAPAIVNYPVISQTVWGEDVPEVRKRTKYLVYLLRRKLQELVPDHDLILNVGRLGYKLQTQP